MWCFPGSLQLQCHSHVVTEQIGGRLVVPCSYDTNMFLFNKKYWCRGESSTTCEVLTDSEQKGGRTLVVDAGRRGLFVTVSDLRREDGGVFWLGIDKVFADVMTPVTVVVTEGKKDTSCVLYNL